MNPPRIKCPICKLEDQELIYAGDYGRKKEIHCDRCGKYSITTTAQVMVESDQPRYRLISWIRDLNEQGAEPPEINSFVLKNIESGLPKYSPSEKQLILLKNIERMTTFPGQTVNIVPRLDYPLAWALNQEELIYYLRNLVERFLLKLDEEENEEISDLSNIVEITASGWEFLEKNKRIASISDQAFVAMSFSPDLKEIWEGAIKQGIEKAGYKAYRVDSKPHSDRIDTKIMTEIKNSRFLVADVTHQRQGVYFEAGYALGLGLPVIWSCRKDDFKNIHFDTRQYNHIRWEKKEDLQEELYNFICAIIGKTSKN